MNTIRPLLSTTALVFMAASVQAQVGPADVGGRAVVEDQPTIAAGNNLSTAPDIGIPDIRGLEYRSVTIAASEGSVLIFQSPPPLKPLPRHLWIMKTAPGEGARGIGWDGVVYDLKSVGEVVDWRQDVRNFLTPAQPDQAHTWPASSEFSARPVARYYLRLLGDTDLSAQAEAKRSLSEPGSVADEYRKNLRQTGIVAFSCGDFAVATRQFQVLKATFIADGPPLPKVMQQLQDETALLLAESERRLNPTPRPVEKIPGLIWDLQNVSVLQISIPGSLLWTLSPTVRQLVDAGDESVEPLLDALEKDDRLTLSVGLSTLAFNQPGRVGTVREVAEATLQMLLGHSYAPSFWGKSAKERAADVATQMRLDWDQMKGLPPTERAFQALAKPGQEPGRLLEAAQSLVRVRSPYVWRTTYSDAKTGEVKDYKITDVFFGEPLRAKTNPSVSDLLEARINELSGRAFKVVFRSSAFNPGEQGDPYSLNRDMAAANQLAIIYAKWDPSRSLSKLGDQLDRDKTFVAHLPPPMAADGLRELERARRSFLNLRIASPQRDAALNEYAAYLQAVPFGRVSAENYAPLWLFPTEPDLQKAAHAIFDAPRAPFQTAAQWNTSDFNYLAAFNLLSSPLIKLPAFQSAVVRELKNITVIGKVAATGGNRGEIRVTAWKWSGQSINLSTQKLVEGNSQPLRVCDLVGFYLHRAEPVPATQVGRPSLVDLSLPQVERDAQLRQIPALITSGEVVSDGYQVLWP